MRAPTLESLAAEAGDILAGIDGPVIVVGQSLGTQVAELVAAQHPDHVRGLVLLTPVPLGGTRLPDEVVAPFRALGGDRVAQRGLRAELSPHLSDEQLDRLADIGAPVAADVTAHYVDVWNNGLRDAPATSAFGGPVLIIRGGADGFVTEQLVDAISPRFVEPEVKVIDKGGHWVHVEYPGTVATMILDFADSVAGRHREHAAGTRALCHETDPAIGPRAATRRQHTDVVTDHFDTDHRTTRRSAGRSTAHHNASGRSR